MIDATKLTKRFGPALAVDQLSFHIDRGQIVGFLGPNGAGKSTTLRMLTGFVPPTSGTVEIDQYNVLTDSEAVRRRIGYLPESTPLYDEMRVDEYLHYHGQLYNMKRAQRRERLGVVTERCGLEKIHHRVIGHLSKGNRQRVGVAQALMHNPPVLILDEPAAGLDPYQITQFREFLTDLRHEHTIILSSHILSEIERVADRVVILREGKLVADGTTDELRRRSRGGERVVVEVQADETEVSKALGSVDGVANVQTSVTAGWTQAVLVPREGEDVRQQAVRVVSGRGWPVRDVTRRGATLEDYYLELFAQPVSEVAA